MGPSMGLNRILILIYLLYILYDPVCTLKDPWNHPKRSKGPHPWPILLTLEFSFAQGLYGVTQEPAGEQQVYDTGVICKLYRPPASAVGVSRNRSSFATASRSSQDTGARRHPP